MALSLLGPSTLRPILSIWSFYLYKQDSDKYNLTAEGSLANNNQRYSNIFKS